MTITAKVIAKSRSPYHTMGAPDIVTFLLRYPRFIHAEVMTHRVFSRNASSSRAIPVKRLIQDVIDDTAMPIHWGKNQPGMQADEQHSQRVLTTSIHPGFNHPKAGQVPISMSSTDAWNEARDRAIDMARAFDEAGYHKQIVNRMLEPFSHINVVVTATNYDNFYWLRRHRDAQPEIKALADAMFTADMAEEPRMLKDEEWHLPFITEEDRHRDYPVQDGFGQIEYVPVDEFDLLKVSTARCARTSYMTHDGRVPVFDEDLKLYRRLVGSEPLHASPTEHQAKNDQPLWGENYIFWEAPSMSGNLDEGWIQFRKTLLRENCTDYTAWIAETLEDKT